MMPASMPCAWLSALVNLYKPSSRKNSGHASNRPSSMARAYSELSWIRRELRSVTGSVMAPMSDPHVAAVSLPESAHRSLGRAGGVGFGGIAAHLHNRHFVARSRYATLDETADASILHRDETGRPDKVSLLDAALPHLRRVVFESEVGPVELHS